MKKLLFLLLLCGLMSACSSESLPKYVTLGDLRVLALTLNMPEVSPGATVTVTPYVSSVSNTGALNFSWIACVDPGLAHGATPSCEGNPTATAVTTGSISTLNTGNAYTGAADPFSVAVPSTILDSRSAQDQYNGVYYLVFYTVQDSAGHSVQSLKRIVVTAPSKTAKNQNPSITSVFANGATFTQLTAGQEHSLSITFGAGSREAYTVQKDDGSFTTSTEDMQVTWFYTDGKTKYYRTLNEDTNVYTAPGTYPTSRNAFLVIVAHDGRGGNSVLKANANP